MKCLILTGKYAQDIEVFYPLYRLQEEGWEVNIAVDGNEAVPGAYGMTIKPTCLVSGPEFLNADLLILPGGARAMEYLRQRSGLLLFIHTFHESGKVIGSICHGTQLLISAGLVRGKKVSGYYSIKDDIWNAGGEFVDAPYVTDGHIVSSPHYKHLGPWMKEVVRVAKSLS